MSVIAVHANVIGNPTEVQLQAAPYATPLRVVATGDVVVRYESAYEGDGSNGYLHVFSLGTLSSADVLKAGAVTVLNGPRSLFCSTV